MLERVGFTVSYTTVIGIIYLFIFIGIASLEGLIIFILDISNAFHNIIPPNPEESVYLNLPRLYM